MTDFPKICELPSVVRTKGWKWDRFSTPSNPSYDFWVGTDSDDIKWLTKLKGGFYGYREIVFAKLAQEMGWSCQTSIFAIFDEESLEKLSIENGNNVHAVHYFMTEHSSNNCKENCPLLPLRGNDLTIEKLKTSQIKSILDLPKSDIAACIFGAGEPSGRFFTASHDFVIIDSEQMFASGPGCLSEITWDMNREDTDLHELKIETCWNIQNLSESTIQRSLDIPSDIHLDELWSIGDRIKASRKAINCFLQCQA